MDPALKSADENMSSFETRDDNGLAGILYSLRAEQLHIQREWQEFTNYVYTIHNMFEDLSENNARFIALKAAADDILLEDFGVNDRLGRLSKMISSCLSAENDTGLARGKLLQQAKDLLMSEEKVAYTIYNSALELIVCAIFELLSISQISLTIQEVQIELTLPAYMGLLRDIYTKTK
ncbi:hypothetical protein F5Y01DRAFT_136622 [Xylaria sp. FL0043]|nr:hypothetical protein F5Y01DRAFT_136622 [Xylaria sp. FL0043]